MTFVQHEFLVFFGIVFALYWGLPDKRVQNLVLWVSSTIFYGWVHPWFLILLYASSVLDFLAGLGMRRYPARAKLFLVLSLSGNLGMLGWFKYFDFFVTNVADALAALGFPTSLHALGIFLPVGISFYTFQTMSYTIDVYRKELEPRRNFLDYIVFVCFFPQLVAGPVVRASSLLVQIERPRTFRWEAVVSGLSLTLWGAFKKIVVADTIAPYVDKMFQVKDPSFPMIAAATLGFAIQILADFAGYTDIARGTARMLGFDLVQNFANPYLARDPSDFWRRWHISFSSWIRDYLYIPLGGSRGGTLATVKATFGAMVLSGLWHGASWNFLIWGFYHAVLITGYRVVRRLTPRSLWTTTAGSFVTIPAMFLFTCAGWLLFRETRGDRLLHYLSLDPFGGSADQWVATVSMLALCAATATPLLVALVVQRVLVPRIDRTRWAIPIHATAWAAMAVGMTVFVRTSALDFIYFQF